MTVYRFFAKISTFRKEYFIANGENAELFLRPSKLGLREVNQKPGFKKIVDFCYCLTSLDSFPKLVIKKKILIKYC